MPSFSQSEEDVDSYIDRYKMIAIREQVNNGVPAAITLAQGIHESACGKSMLATEGNNHFGIKCKSTWKGETILHDDDERQECFRKYSSAEQSYIDHSVFLRDNNRYHFLFDIEVTDYKAWASGLKRAGYATNPAYVSRLTNLIEKYNLQQYTYEALKKTYGTTGEIVPEKDAPIEATQSVEEIKPTVTQVGAGADLGTTKPEAVQIYYKGLKGFYAQKGEDLKLKSFDLGIRYPRLLMLNDLADAPLERDQFIFTEKKRKVGTTEFHVVKEGEDMHSISQSEAIMMDVLYQYNQLYSGQEPAVGERLNLQYKILQAPRLRNPSSVKPEIPNPNPVTVRVEPAPAKENQPVVSTPEPEERGVDGGKAAAIRAARREKQTEEVKVETPIAESKVEEAVPAEERNIDGGKAAAIRAARQEKQTEEVNVETPTADIRTERVVTRKQTEIQTTTPPLSENPIIEEETAKRVEALLATDNKREVSQLATEQEEKERLEKEKKEAMEREMIERMKQTDQYVQSVTQKIDQDRVEIEKRENEELRKKRELEEVERKRIEEEQAERERLEAAQLKASQDAMTSTESERIRKEQELAEGERIERERIEKERIERERWEEEERKKRKYDEPGVSDSVKSLKRKWDDVVYRKLPERKPILAPKATVDSLPKNPVPKPTTQKPVTPKPTTTKPANSKPTQVVKNADTKAKATTKTSKNAAKKETGKSKSSGKESASDAKNKAKNSKSTKDKKTTAADSKSKTAKKKK